MKAKIHKNTPLPQRRKSRKVNYPWSELEVNDSVFSEGYNAVSNANEWGRRNERKFGELRIFKSEHVGNKKYQITRVQ